MRSRFRLIWLAPVLAVLALGAWVFASPMGASPDDDYHLVSIWCANDGRSDLCEPAADDDQREVAPALPYAACYALDAEASAACQLPWLAEGSEPTTATNRGSFENAYPPIYYGTMNLFAGTDFQTSAIAMRFVNVAVFVGFAAALFALLPIRLRSSLLWAWLITTVPLGLFLIASNNPSSWAITGVGTAWLALYGYLESTGHRRVLLGVLFGLSVVVAAGARADAAVYVGLATVLVCFLRFERSRQFLVAAILPAAMIVVAVVLFLSASQAFAAAEGLGDQTPPLEPFALIAYNLLNVPSLWAGVFGSWGLGWLDTEMPAVVAVGALSVFVAVSFAALRHSSLRKAVSVAIVGLVLWLLPTYILVRGGDTVGANVQPRYLLPLIVLLAGLLLLTVNRHRFSVSRLQAVVIGLALGIAQAVALHVNIRRYVTGIDEPGVNLDSGYEWWWSAFPLSPMAIWALGSLAFSGLLVVLLRHLVRDRELTEATST